MRRFFQQEPQIRQYDFAPDAYVRETKRKILAKLVARLRRRGNLYPSDETTL